MWLFPLRLMLNFHSHFLHLEETTMKWLNLKTIAIIHELMLLWQGDYQE